MVAGLGEADAEGVAFGGSQDDAEDEAEAEEVPDGPEVWRDVVVVAVAEALAEEEARPLAVAVGFLTEGDGRAVGAVTAAPLAEAEGPRDGVDDAEFPLPERPLLDCSLSLEVAELPGISVSGAKGVPPMMATVSTVAYPTEAIPATTPTRRNRRALRPEESTNTGPSEPVVRTRRRARRVGSARPSATGCDFMTAR